MADTLEQTSEIQRKYEKALKNNKDLIILHQGKEIKLDPEDSSTCQSSTSLRISPAVISVDESTVVCGYFVEPGTDRGENDYVKDKQSRHVGSTEFSNMEEFVFYNINDLGKSIVAPVKTVRKAKKKPEKKSVKLEKPKANATVVENIKLNDVTMNKRSFDCNTTKKDPTKPELIEVYASIGGTVTKRNKVKTVIPCTKILDSVFVGCVGFRTKTLRSVFKFHFDQNLCMKANSILQNEQAQKVLIELCT